MAQTLILDPVSFSQSKTVISGQYVKVCKLYSRLKQEEFPKLLRKKIRISGRCGTFVLPGPYQYEAVKDNHMSKYGMGEGN